VNMAKKRGEIKEKLLDVAERARLKELEEEVRRLKMEREILKSVGVVCELRQFLLDNTPRDMVSFSHRHDHPIRSCTQELRPSKLRFLSLSY
jgi:hypothetical protein